MADRVPDLSSLNDAERTVLHMLARGHTAKSIAAATGRSEASINERLREARRKTGMGSSRELARVFAAQENRDEQIGVAANGGAGAATVAEAASPVADGVSTGVVIMAVLLFAGAAFAGILFQLGEPQEAPTSDSIAEEIVGKADQMPPQLYKRLRGEPRDTEWAPGAEAALRTRYGAVPGVSTGGDLRVTCGTSLCEIMGTIEPGSKHDFPAMQALQASPIENDMRRQGFKGRSAMGFGGNDVAGRMRFFTYWVRADR